MRRGGEAEQSLAGLEEGHASGQASAETIDGICLLQCAGRVRCASRSGKGRVLLAGRSFSPGEVILEVDPLLSVASKPGLAAFEAVRAACNSRADDLPFDPVWYWATLLSCTQQHRNTWMEEAVMSWVGAPPAVDYEVHRKLLMLCGGDEACEELPGADIAPLLQALGIDVAFKPLLNRLLRVWALNGFEVSDLEPRSLAVYFVPSMMSHSCLPSAVWMLTDAGRFALRARRDVPNEGEVTISYLSENGLLEPSMTRRLELQQTKRFWCACSRCAAGEPDLTRGFACPAPGCQGAVFAPVADGVRRVKRRKRHAGLAVLAAAVSRSRRQRLA